MRQAYQRHVVYTVSIGYKLGQNGTKTLLKPCYFLKVFVNHYIISIL